MRARKIDAESRGSEVMTYLRGDAEKMVKHITEYELEQPGGDELIFAILDERYPEESANSRLGTTVREALKPKL